jgi:hypothetical protein
MEEQVVMGVTLAAAGTHAWVAWFVLAIMCVYISAYAASWGPLGWLYSSEARACSLPCTAIEAPFAFLAEMHICCECRGYSLW